MDGESSPVAAANAVTADVPSAESPTATVAPPADAAAAAPPAAPLKPEQSTPPAPAACLACLPRPPAAAFSPSPFLLEQHARFFAVHLATLPSAAQSLDLNRMTLAYFAASGLDLIGRLPDRQALIEWIYSLQVLPGPGDSTARRGGFRPGPYSGAPPVQGPSGCAGCPSWHDGDVAHVTMTQCALAILTIAGDDLGRVDKEAVSHHLSELQTNSGCFMNARFGSEEDVRFVYGACVVCELLGDWSGLDTARAAAFLAKCQRYDGGFGECPHAEGHGGTTYCAVASLAMMRRLDVIDVPALVHWVVHRQGQGFNGRPNKLEDTCYSYWLGCTMALVQSLSLVDTALLQEFTFGCQHARRGGVSKHPRGSPDLLHSYLSIAALGLFGRVPEVACIDPALGFARRHVAGRYEARQGVLRAQVAAQMALPPAAAES